MLGGRAIRTAIGLVARTLGQPIAPTFDHVEAFRMPQMRLQPHVTTLAAHVLELQLTGFAPVLARRPFGGRRNAALAHLRGVRGPVFARQPLRVVRHGASTHVRGQRLKDELRLVRVADGAEQRFDLGDTVGGVAVGLDGVGQLDGAAEAGIVLDFGGHGGGGGGCITKQKAVADAVCGVAVFAIAMFVKSTWNGMTATCFCYDAPADKAVVCGSQSVFLVVFGCVL